MSIENYKINPVIKLIVLKKGGGKTMNVTKKLRFINYFAIVVLIIGIFSFSIVQMKKQEVINTSATNNISNKKIGWGIKRNDNHEQPDVGRKIKDF